MSYRDKHVLTLRQIGEFELLKIIRKQCRQFPFPSKCQLKVPLGDDTFGVKLTSNPLLLCTTDTLVEGTHFNFDWCSKWLNKNEIPMALAHKLVTANLSDLAAMGGSKPLFAFLTLGLNGDISVNFVDNLYTKILKLAKEYGFIVAGGDIIRAEKSILSMFILGESTSHKILLRKGAKKGDILMATGPLGLSALGLKIMKNQANLSSKEAKKMVYFHLFPEPKLKEGEMLASDDIMATSCMDSSDDLMSSLEMLSQASNVGFEISLESVPLHPLLLKISKKLCSSPYEFFLYGGEDYQLLFTVPAKSEALVKKKIPSAVTLGQVKEKTFGIQIKMKGKPFALQNRRFRHF